MFADDLTETLLVQMIHTMGENGIDISGKEFVRDIGFVIEAVKSTVYRDMNLAHPMSKIMEMLTKIDVDEKNSMRSEVDLEREFTFAHSTQKWKGVPIIAANMDTTGTFEVYNVLSKHKMITCFNKFYTTQDYQNMKSKHGLNPDYFMISTGINEQNMCNLHDIVQITNAKWICVDVANGYMTQVVTFCEKLRV